MSLPRFRIRRRTAALGFMCAIPLVAGLAFIGMSCKPPPKGSSSSSGPETAKASYFDDVSKTCGVDYSFRNGEKEEGYPNHMGILESLGGGIGLIDYDHSGRLSIFVCGGGYYGGKDMTEI